MANPGLLLHRKSTGVSWCSGRYHRPPRWGRTWVPLHRESCRLIAKRIFKPWIWRRPHRNDSNFCWDGWCSSELSFAMCFGSRPSISPSSIPIPVLQRPPPTRISTQLSWIYVQFYMGKLPYSFSSFQKGGQCVDDQILLEGRA